MKKQNMQKKPARKQQQQDVVEGMIVSNHDDEIHSVRASTTTPSIPHQHREFVEERKMKKQMPMPQIEGSVDQGDDAAAPSRQSQQGMHDICFVCCLVGQILFWFRLITNISMKAP